MVTHHWIFQVDKPRSNRCRSRRFWIFVLDRYTDSLVKSTDVHQITSCSVQPRNLGFGGMSGRHSWRLDRPPGPPPSQEGQQCLTQARCIQGREARPLIYHIPFSAGVIDMHACLCRRLIRFEHYFRHGRSGFNGVQPGVYGVQLPSSRLGHRHAGALNPAKVRTTFEPTGHQTPACKGSHSYDTPPFFKDAFEFCPIFQTSWIDPVVTFG